MDLEEAAPTRREKKSEQLLSLKSILLKLLSQMEWKGSGCGAAHTGDGGR